MSTRVLVRRSIGWKRVGPIAHASEPSLNLKLGADRWAEVQTIFLLDYAHCVIFTALGVSSIFDALWPCPRSSRMAFWGAVDLAVLIILLALASLWLFACSTQVKIFVHIIRSLILGLIQLRALHSLLPAMITEYHLRSLILASWWSTQRIAVLVLAI